MKKTLIALSLAAGLVFGGMVHADSMSPAEAIKFVSLAKNHGVLAVEFKTLSQAEEFVIAAGLSSNNILKKAKNDFEVLLEANSPAPDLSSKDCKSTLNVCQ